MSVHPAIAVFALALGFGFVRLSRGLVWSSNPGLTFANTAGGVATSWVLCIGYRDMVIDVTTLLCAGALLVALCQKLKVRSP
jgi:hypothetical protein